MEIDQTDLEFGPAQPVEQAAKTLLITHEYVAREGRRSMNFTSHSLSVDREGRRWNLYVRNHGDKTEVLALRIQGMETAK